MNNLNDAQKKLIEEFFQNICDTYRAEKQVNVLWATLTKEEQNLHRLRHSFFRIRKSMRDSDMSESDIDDLFLQCAGQSVEP